MKWVNRVSGAMLVASCALASSAFARNPINETAQYKVDKTGGRTSGVISSGKLSISILRPLSSPEEPSTVVAYEARLDFDVQARILGQQTGNLSIRAPSEFFTPEFWDQLRVNKFYDTGDFKVKHEGMVASTKAMDGKVYENLDQIFIYDIKPTADNGWAALVRALVIASKPEFAANPEKLQGLTDIQVRALRHESVPALEVVKADLTGKYSGVAVKAGGDYVSPAFVE